jgi:hypothetical protein
MSGGCEWVVVESGQAAKLNNKTPTRLPKQKQKQKQTGDECNEHQHASISLQFLAREDDVSHPVGKRMLHLGRETELFRASRSHDAS